MLHNQEKYMNVGKDDIQGSQGVREAEDRGSTEAMEEKNGRFRRRRNDWETQKEKKWRSSAYVRHKSRYPFRISQFWSTYLEEL